jgi:hypothetical protein
MLRLSCCARLCHDVESTVRNYGDEYWRGRADVIDVAVIDVASAGKELTVATARASLDREALCCVPSTVSPARCAPNSDGGGHRHVSALKDRAEAGCCSACTRQATSGETHVGLSDGPCPNGMHLDLNELD